jgi:putative transposase
MDVVDADDYVIGEAPAPIAVATDNGPCFRGVTFADAFAGDDPLFRHVRARVRSPQTNTYDTLRPHQALDERTPRAAYLAVEHCD